MGPIERLDPCRPLAAGAGSLDRDQLFGDAGNDPLVSLDAAADTLDGGAGFDRHRSDSDDDLVSNCEGILS
jgi:hypothetical protein